MCVCVCVCVGGGGGHMELCIWERKLLSYRKPKRVVQNEENGHTNLNDSPNYDIGTHDEIEHYEWNSKRSI